MGICSVRLSLASFRKKSPGTRDEPLWLCHENPTSAEEHRDILHQLCVSLNGSCHSLIILHLNDYVCTVWSRRRSGKFLQELRWSRVITPCPDWKVWIPIFKFNPHEGAKWRNMLDSDIFICKWQTWVSPRRLHIAIDCGHFGSNSAYPTGIRDISHNASILAVK